MLGRGERKKNKNNNKEGKNWNKEKKKDKGQKWYFLHHPLLCRMSYQVMSCMRAMLCYADTASAV